MKVPVAAILKNSALKMVKKTIDKLKKYFGKAKVKTTDEELHRVREEVAIKYAKKFGITLD